MRKLVLFALIFGGGLALLLWLQARRPTTPSEVGPGPVGEQADAPEREFADVPVVPEGRGDERDPLRSAQNVRVRVDGPLDLIRRRESDGRVQYRIRSADVDQEEDAILELHEVEAEIYSEESGELSARLESARGRGRLLVEDGRFDPDYPMDFERVVLGLEEDWPFAPLSIRIPSLVGSLSSELLLSDDPVQIEGRGLSASATGLRLDRAELRLTLGREAHVALDLLAVAGDPWKEVRVDAERRLRLWNRPDLGEDWVELEALDGARLELLGDRRLVLQGHSLGLIGRLIEDGRGGRGLVPSEATLSGQAAIDLDGDTYLGGRATLEFDPNGRPLRALLEERPRVELHLSGAPAQELGVALPEGQQPILLTASGRGPLQVELEGGEAFDFQGPIELLLPELDGRLTARGRLRGRRTPAGELSGILATGGIAGNVGGWSLTGRELDAAPPPPEGDGPAFLRLLVGGPARLEGPLEDGGEIAVTARDEITLLRAPDLVRVPHASGVEITVTGEGGLKARADELRDLDTADRSFTAEGGVSLIDARGRASCQRLISFGGDRARLEGSRDRPARLDLPEGHLQALRIEALPDVVIASGEASGSVLLSGRRLELRGRTIRAQRRMPAPEVGEAGSDEGGPAPRTGERVLEADGPAWARRGGGGSGEGGPRALEVEADWLRATAAAEGAAAEVPAGFEEIEPRLLFARGDVAVDVRGDLSVSARGQALSVDARGNGQLRAPEGERVRVEGSVRGEGIDFELTADRLDFCEGMVAAQGIDLEARGVVMPLGPASSGEAASTMRAVAGSAVWDRRTILLGQGVFLASLGERGEIWSLDAPDARICCWGEDEGGKGPGVLRELLVWGGFVARLGDQVELRGQTLLADRVHERVIARGAPARIFTPRSAGESSRFEWDARSGLLRADRGTLRTRPQAGAQRLSTGAGEEQAWSMSFASMEPVVEDDQVLQAVREPVIVLGDTEARAAWAVMWVDPQGWARFSRPILDAAEGPDPDPPLEPQEAPLEPMPSLLEGLMGSQVREWLREVYLEGNIEILQAGERRLRAEALYLDLVLGNGWLQKANLLVDMPSERFPGRRLSIEVDWLRHSADGSLLADGATLTTCDFASPHFRLCSGGLRITPQEGEEEEDPYWEVQIRDNGLQIEQLPRIPLPTIQFPMRQDFRVDPGELSLLGVRPGLFGSSALLGFFIRVELDFRLGAIAKAVHRVVGDGKRRLRGRNVLALSWFDDRGPSLGVETTMEERGRYWLRQRIDGVYDRGRDRGLFRVDREDRSDLRAWYRLRGRYLLGPSEWIDLVVSHQTDAGVQAEFFEREYLRFEERESFVHWRRAAGDRYSWASAEVRLDDFRTQVEELPEVGHYRGLHQIAQVKGVPLLYTGSTRAGWYRRREGDPRWADPFADGLGERELMRFDTQHRLEAPVPLGSSGLTATTHLEGRLTAWDEAAAADEHAPLRAALEGGLELSTTLWRIFEGGARHEVAPTLGVRSHLATASRGGDPVPIDRAEDPVGGDFLDLGLRTRWVAADGRTAADAELRETYGRDLPEGLQDGWQPLSVLSRFRFDLAGIPTGALHEGRYDLDSGEASYSRSLVAFQLSDPLQLELGYHSARDLAGDPLYDAASVETRYRLSPKWEVELRQTLSTRGDGRLHASAALRRFGHDFLVGIEVSETLGEGASLRVEILPLLLYQPDEIWLLER